MLCHVCLECNNAASTATACVHFIDLRKTKKTKIICELLFHVINQTHFSLIAHMYFLVN